MSRTAASAADGNYRIEVADFGPIEHAAVDLRPLTVFAGPSNTGKSYLAMLVYALHRIFGSFQPATFRLPSYPFRLADVFGAQAVLAYGVPRLSAASTSPSSWNPTTPNGLHLPCRPRGSPCGWQIPTSYAGLA